jgi:flagellar hook-associated protein 3 FlgL
MFASISPSTSGFLSNLNQIESRISTDEQQLSSGLRVTQASDAPDEISSILQLRAQISGVTQVQQNLATVSPQVSGGENAIQQAIQVMDTATSLATEAAGSTSSASQRLDIVPQIQSIMQQLVSLSQTSVSGQYIFSGDQGSQPMYTLNSANGNGVQQNISPGPPGQIEDSNGIPFSIGLTAQQIFDDRNADGSYATDNVFAAVNGLMTALQNNDNTGIETAINNLQAASGHLNDESSFYGAAQNTITNATNQAGQTLTNLQQQLSSEQDADAVQVSVDLNTAMTNQQAALAAEAENKPQSLFNYLG